MSGFISEELFYINHCHEAISQGPNSHLPPSHSLWRLQAVSNITPLPLSSLTWILKWHATLWSVVWRVVLSTMLLSLITISRTSIKWRGPTPSLWTPGIKLKTSRCMCEILRMALILQDVHDIRRCLYTNMARIIFLL